MQVDADFYTYSSKVILQAYIWLQVLIILLPMLLLRNNILRGAGLWVAGW
jgi:hypothetical protein